jgi:hypothetical protein
MVPIEPKDCTGAAVERCRHVDMVHGAATSWTSGYRFPDAVGRAGSGSGQPARCRADCGCVPGLIVVRALSATGEAIALIGLAEAAGGGEGGETL